MHKLCSNCIYEALPEKIVSYKEKETVFMEGDELLHAYIIIEGLVKVSKISINGEEKIFDIFGPGDFIALVSMLKQDSNYIVNATCLTSVKLKALRRDQVLESYKANDDFRDQCLTCAMNRTNLFQSQLFLSSNSDIEEKIMSVLEYLSKKFGILREDMYTLKLPFSKTVLASIIGIRRETLSRKLSSMQNDGLIEIDKNTYRFYKNI